MPAILNETVTTMIGRIRRAEQRVSVLPANPGVDGNLVVKSGWSAPECQLTTTTRISGTLNTVLERDVAYHKLIGQTGTVTDGTGVGWLDCTVLAVECEWFGTHESNVWLLVARWRILPGTFVPT